MEPSEPTLKKFCPTCGQKLAIPTRDLSLVVQCPRCATQLSVGEFVGVNSTLPVVVSARPAPQLAEQPPPTTSSESAAVQLAESPADALRSAGASVVAGAASTVSLGVRVDTRLDEALHGHRGKMLLGGALLGALLVSRSKSRAILASSARRNNLRRCVVHRVRRNARPVRRRRGTLPRRHALGTNPDRARSDA